MGESDFHRSKPLSFGRFRKHCVRFEDSPFVWPEQRIPARDRTEVLGIRFVMGRTEGQIGYHRHTAVPGATTTSLHRAAFGRQAGSIADG